MTKVIKKKKTKSRYISVKDLVVAFTLKGDNGLDDLKLTDKAHLLRRAITYCAESQVSHSVRDGLLAYAHSRGISVWSGRGRGAPEIGETRSYKAQQVTDQDPFIRLPLKSLNITKGQIVTASFKNGSILVESKASDV
jgi:hypothetical protein